MFRFTATKPLKHSLIFRCVYYSGSIREGFFNIFYVSGPYDFAFWNIKPNNYVRNNPTDIRARVNIKEKRGPEGFTRDSRSRIKHYWT